MLGFAGPRVIANTINAELPEGFQTSEFMLAHGYDHDGRMFSDLSLDTRRRP